MKRLRALDGELSPMQIVMICLNAMAKQKEYMNFVAWVYSSTYKDWFKQIILEKEKQVQKTENQAGLYEEFDRCEKEFSFLFTIAFASSQELEAKRCQILYTICLIQQNGHEAKQKAQGLWIEIYALQQCAEHISKSYFDKQNMFVCDQIIFINETLKWLQEYLKIDTHPGMLSRLRVKAKTASNALLIEFCFTARHSVLESDLGDLSLQQVINKSFALLELEKSLV
jgi:hypothetical protein